MRTHQLMIVVGVLFLIAGLVFGVTAQEPEAADPLGEPPSFLGGFYEAWVNSPHARFEDEAFVHWDEDGEIPETCATCHSTPGYLDFLGADGSEAGVVDTPHEIGSVVNCDACHNAVTVEMTAVTFPSGVTIDELDDSSRCMVCHQGRSWGGSVDAAIEAAGVPDLNTVSEDLRFINIHYYAAAATRYGGEVHGGYEFEGMRYQPRFEHVGEYATCASCHDPHTLELKVADCATCHEGVETVEDVQNIRFFGSMIDYDGDGDMEEGIKGEIDTLQEMLYTAIQAYAAEVVEAPIIHAESYPYWFNDTNGDGEAGEDEAVFPNAYASFTGRLVQATYNYQVSLKDPGGYAHNAKYHIELLYDTIMALNGELSEPIDLSQAQRNDPGHFDATDEPFRHWDEDGEVSGSCAKCHTAEGLPFFLEHGVNIAVEPSDSLACETCHAGVAEGDFTPISVAEVEFPSGAVLSFGEEEPDNLCLNCHQGRDSSPSVAGAIAGAGVGPDETSEALRFRNPHYFAAGASIFGGEAQGGFQFEGMEYSGRFEHDRRVNTCSACHGTHSLEVREQLCVECHEAVEESGDVHVIRAEAEDADPVDYDGDGDVEEPIADEIAALEEALFAAIQTYAADVAGSPIVYEPASYPYWFIDQNGNGVADPEESNRDNSYASWTPNLVSAIYNYTYVEKDPGIFAHNADYALQLLYDSIEVLGGDVADFTRAPVGEGGGRRR